MDRAPWLAIVLLQCFVAVNAFPDFLITVPARVYSGEEFDFCVTFPGDFFDGAIEVNALMNLDLETVKYRPQTYLSVSDAIKCQKLSAPRPEGYWRFNVTLKNFGTYKQTLPPWFPSLTNKSATYSQEVRVNSRREDPDVTLIQTDKPLYKPGQTVRFRILRLKANKNLLPDTNKISWVYIENPSNIRIRQWKEVPTTQGIASLELLLSEDPPLGTWIIKAIYRDNKEYSNTFDVKEYVLPKYEVTVTPPAYLLSNSPTIDAEVCAKYTYGKSVRGQLNVKICYNSQIYGGFYGWRRSGAQFVRPCTERILEIDGCTKVSVNSSEIELNSRKYSIWGELKINASVTEAGTGIVLSGESKGPQVTTVSCTLELTDETDGFFKPAFPYRGKLTAKNPDGTPVRERRISIRASSYQQYNWRLSLNVTTDDNGEALFGIRDLPENLTSFSIEALDKDLQDEDDSLYHKLAPATAYRSVTRWFSPSNSYIQIEKPQQPLACGREAQLDILYSTPVDTNYNFIIMVKSRDRVVYTANKKHQFSEVDAIELATDDSSQYLKKQNVPTTTPRPRRTPPTPPTPPTTPLPPRIKNVTFIPSEPVTVKTTTPPLILSRKRRSEKSCRDNAGKSFDEGTTFAPNISDPCVSCMCDGGEAKGCAIIMCDEPGCPNYRLIPGTCCGFVCLEDDELDLCVDKDGKRVANGETYTPDGTDPCKTCSCMKGEPGPCHYKFCSPPTCKRYEMIPGTCCGFVCLEDEEETLDVCVDKDGKDVANGEMYTPDGSDPCRTCVCMKGEPAEPCAVADCFPPTCKRYEMKPGTCCDFVCLEGEKETLGVPCMDEEKNSVNHGETFAPNRSDPCRMCSCVNGEATQCSYIYCDAPQCERYELIEGTCCGFICLDEPEGIEKKSCVDEFGNTIEDGESSLNHRDPCKQCECHNGDLYCAEEFCVLPECRRFRYIEGTCCEVVCDDEDAEESNFVGRVPINIPVSAAFAPEAQVIVFYVREDGEIVSSNTKLSVEKCFDNKVTMQFENSPIRPGSNATIRLTADAGSACSIGVVDKSLELLKADHQLTPEKFYNLLNTEMQYDHYFPYQDYQGRNCRERNQDGSRNFDVKLVHNPGDIPVDSYKAFQNFGFKVITNLKLETRPCVEYIYPMYNRIYAENSVVDEIVPSSGKSVSEKVRSFFPETWLWELEIVGTSGQSTLIREIPDTITEWKGNALCLNSFTGLGISPVSGITAFQPFFLSFTLPYSAVRNEVVPVLVTVFNYLSECLVMRVSLRDSDEFKLQSSSARTRTVCVCGGDSDTLRYLVTPLKIGKINIQAEAESLADDGTCGNSVVSRDSVGVSDAVRRELLVDAEGIENEYTYSSYLCPSGEPDLKLTEKISLRVPTDRIQDSERGFVNVIGDVMGPALTNLKDLLRMPYGCGEQNMASFAPNIFVLQYFYNTNQDVSRVLEDALKYMRVGYQRQLKYRHSDGSYSAFGDSDGKSGSTWLTAFVVKCLGQSQKYIDIDQVDLSTSISWFRRQQNEIGCFPKVGYTHSYYLKGGWGKGNDDEGTLTAFILIAMLEAGLPKNDTAVLGALRCLDLQEVKDTYMLTLMAYAYSLYDVKSTRRLEIMSLLRSKVKRKGRDMVYWSRDSEPEEEITTPWGYSRAASAEVEMTSYALLTYIVGNQPEAVINAKPIVMWLSKQRNAQGGFSSTQDTIIALQALSVYGSLVHQGGMNITVEVSGKQMAAAYGISDENKLVLQSVPIPLIPNELTVTVRGVGCALVQANVKYNTPDSKSQPDFSVKISTHRSKYDPNNCARRSINICASYKGASGQTKMAIVDVKMQTGWIPVRETLNKILSSVAMNTVGLQKYEIDGNIVHLYFEYFDAHNRCFLFDVEQDIELSNPEPAYVKIYDYYETESSVTAKYDIKTTCGTKEELPYLTPEEYLIGLNRTDSIITQVRIPTGTLTPDDSINGEPGPPGVLSCPVCMEAMDVKSQDFSDLVCNSARIFKVKTARKDGVKYSMKLYADMKPKKKMSIKKFANHRIQKSCSCGVLELKDEKLMVFDTQDQYNPKQKEIGLSKTTTIVRWTKLFERKVFRKNKKC